MAIPKGSSFPKPPRRSKGLFVQPAKSKPIPKGTGSASTAKSARRGKSQTKVRNPKSGGGRKVAK